MGRTDGEVLVAKEELEYEEGRAGWEQEEGHVWLFVHNRRPPYADPKVCFFTIMVPGIVHLWPDPSRACEKVRCVDKKRR
jgi:hypothetical protein